MPIQKSISDNLIQHEMPPPDPPPPAGVAVAQGAPPQGVGCAPIMSALNTPEYFRPPEGSTIQGELAPADDPSCFVSPVLVNGGVPHGNIYEINTGKRVWFQG